MEKKELELYVHIPFCVKKCAYCDFLSAPADVQERTLYVDALTEEIRVQKDDYKDYQVSTVFLGGGTPSILNGNEITRIFDALYESFDISDGAEITVEVNSGTVTEEKAEAWKKCGVNRLSIGLQSVNDRELQMLGRIHSYREFLDTWEIVRGAGFQNVNIDLISAIPGQTLESWCRTLRTAAELGPEHISAYSLIVEKGTPFYEMYGENADCDSGAEIGCGTGIYTGLICSIFNPEHLYINDICPEMEDIAGQASGGKAVFIHGDAETIRFPERLTLITSCSAIQWFYDLRAFFLKCHSSLNDGGMLAFSTFGDLQRKAGRIRHWNHSRKNIPRPSGGKTGKYPSHITRYI